MDRPTRFTRFFSNQRVVGRVYLARMVRASRSRVGPSAVDEALALAGPVKWTRHFCGMGLRSSAARRYARVLLDEWHGPRAAASLENRSKTLSFVQSAELHVVSRNPEGKLAIAAANVAGDLEQGGMSRTEITRQVRTIVRAASEIHALRTHAGQSVDARVVALAGQVRRLAALRAKSN
jgi:hypothetical protein